MTINRAHQIIGGSGKQQMLLPGYPLTRHQGRADPPVQAVRLVRVQPGDFTRKSGNWFVKSQFKFFI